MNEFMCSEGVQILLKEYDFESRKHPTFTEDDIMNLFPIVKHTNPKVSRIFVLLLKYLNYTCLETVIKIFLNEGKFFAIVRSLSSHLDCKRRGRLGLNNVSFV